MQIVTSVERDSQPTMTHECGGLAAPRGVHSTGDADGAVEGGEAVVVGWMAGESE